MTTYASITNSEVASGAPGTQSLFERLRDNPLATIEGDVTAPDILGKAGASVKLLETAVASNDATVDLITGIDSTYDQYVIRITDYQPVTDGSLMRMRVSSDTGSSFITDANYTYAGRSTNATATETDTNSTGDTAFEVSGSQGVGSASAESMDMTIIMRNPSSSSKYISFTWEGSFRNSTGVLHYFRGAGSYAATTAMDAIRIFQSTGNILTGNFALYGIKKI